MTYSVRLILHQKTLRPCSDTKDADQFDTALVWLYGPDAGPKADNGPFPCRHGMDAIIRTCRLEVPTNDMPPGSRASSPSPSSGLNPEDGDDPAA